MAPVGRSRREMRGPGSCCLLEATTKTLLDRIVEGEAGEEIQIGGLMYTRHTPSGCREPRPFRDPLRAEGERAGLPGLRLAAHILRGDTDLFKDMATLAPGLDVALVP